MYVRFVITKKDPTSCVPRGIIHAAYDLSDAGRFSSEGEAHFQDLRRWFNDHLRVPRRFSRSRRSGAHRHGICWFKDNALGAIRLARILATLLEDHGHPTQMLICRRPGYIVYEDEQQVVAEPFRRELRQVLRRS
jgi:hypothetical protein